tara:strand:+ start:350 stop:844 length:495 start_codon:yes stop_codon:yes gene_type:complete
MTINIKDSHLPITSLFHPDGTGGCNGLAHTQNPAHFKEQWVNHFPHRTEQEALFHKALKGFQKKIREAEGVSFIFSPLPVFSDCGRRIETDFLILKDKVALVIEIDGDSHSQKLAIEEKLRLDSFEENGFPILRINCSQESDIEWAHTAAEKALSRLEREIKRR